MLFLPIIHFVRTQRKQKLTGPKALKLQSLRSLSTSPFQIVYNSIHISMWNSHIPKPIAITRVKVYFEESYPKVIHIPL